MRSASTGDRIIDREDKRWLSPSGHGAVRVADPGSVAWGRGGGEVLCCLASVLLLADHRHRSGLVPAPPPFAVPGARIDCRPRLGALLGVCAAWAVCYAPRNWRPSPARSKSCSKGLRQSFDRQRQLTGDAAHELKTSIAVLKSSLQLPVHGARTPEQYEAGLEGRPMDSERMEDLVNRMPTLARLEESPMEQAAASELHSMVHLVMRSGCSRWPSCSRSGWTVGRAEARSGLRDADLTMRRCFART